MYPTLLAFCNEMSATLARLLAYLGAIFVLGVIAAKMCGLPRAEAAVEPAPRQSWINIERPHRAFPLILPEFASEPDSHRSAARGASLRGADWIAAPGDPQLRGRVAAK